MSPPLTPKARALVTAGRAGLDPTGGDLERVRRRVLVAVGAASSAAAGAASVAMPSSAQAAGAGATAVSGSGVAAGFKIALVLVLTGAAVAGGGALLSLARQPSAVLPDVASPAPRPPPPAAPAPSPSAQPGVDFDFAPDRVEEPRRPSSVPRTRAPRPESEPPAAPPSLSQELTLVRRARSALRLGMPDRALELLAQHAERFPAARLAEEAAVVRIEALCASGDQARARSLTGEFARRWPHSPLRARVWNMCGADGAIPDEGSRGP